MLCVTKAFQLEDIGKEWSLSVATSIDGASLSKNLSIVAGGIKVTNCAAQCPLTNQLFLENPCTMSAQSWRLCIPFKILMGRETKESFCMFRMLFQFFDDLSDEQTISDSFHGFKPFECMTNCDLSAQWKGLCKGGGAAKVHTLPCTCCATESNQLAEPNLRACTRWCHEHSFNPDWVCFHKPIATPETVESMCAEVQELVLLLECAFGDIQENLKMAPFDIESESSKHDAASIHFQPENYTERQGFSLLITDELILRGLDASGTLEE
jgi:hypothetical protein